MLYMGIFNHVSKNKSTNIQSGIVNFDVIFSDYVRNDDLNNYYKKLELIDVGGNKVSSLGEPTEATDAMNRNFLYRRPTAATGNIKSDFTTTLSELSKTNNEKVNDLETKIIRETTDLLEMNKLITNQITVVTNTLDLLNKKDVVTDEGIKKINNTLTTSLQDIETKMVDFIKSS